MKLTGAFLAVLAVLAGCGRTPKAANSSPEQIWLAEQFRGPREAGMAAMRAGDFATAAREFAQGAKAASDASDEVSEGRFRANLGAVHLLRGENREAIGQFLAARRAAADSGDTATQRGVEGNLASVYIQTRDYQAAAEAAARAKSLAAGDMRLEGRVNLAVLCAIATSKAYGYAKGREEFEAAKRDAAVSPALTAEVLDAWGNEATEAGEYTEAGSLLHSAWSARAMAKDGRSAMTAAKLARLYRKREEPAEAAGWMARVDSARKRGEKIAIAPWILSGESAHIAAANGKNAEALRRYREAIAEARTWREAAPRAARLRVGAEQRMMRELIEGYMNTALLAAAKRPRPDLSAEMFTLLQDTQAWSLESGAPGLAGARERAEARRLEARWLSGEAGAGSQLRAVRAAYLEKFDAAGDASAMPADRLRPPAPGEAVLTYWLAEPASRLWVWTSRGLRTTTLPGRAALRHRAERFRAAVLGNTSSIRLTGQELLTGMLGALQDECLRADRWEIVSEETLIDAPLAALPLAGGRYLAEQIELRWIPNARTRSWSGTENRRFLAIADPVFHPSDERWGGPRPSLAPLLLARLPGTRLEAESAAAVWRGRGYAARIQAGRAASEETVLDTLRDWKPDIVHLATHTISPPGGGDPRLALAVRTDGSPGILTAEDIAATPAPCNLVVLSACRSGGAPAPRGAGFLGLTRAWLTAGARQVVATLWPVGDATADFFAEFHKQAASGANAHTASAAGALRQAQIWCVRTGGERAQPRYWAGYVALARRESTNAHTSR